MKTFKILTLFFAIVYHSHGLNAQDRTQLLNQYTSVFISSPNNGTVIQSIHDDSDQDDYYHSDRFWKHTSGNYVELDNDNGADVMQPGKGYVIQIGGNGTYTDIIRDDRRLDFSGGGANGGTISTGVDVGFNLLGNPYGDFLDLDLFLLNSNNATKVKGPIMLWSHNTIVSAANQNPNDPQAQYRNSANDFALYNVLGGVAAGREISTSDDNGTQTGIQTPNGKLWFGTGFGIYATASGNATYENSMRTSSNGGATQSFRQSSTIAAADSRVENFTPTTRSRIWLNLELGVPPSSPNPNFNPLKQILVGYSPCYGSECPTTGDSDRVFDAETVTATSSPLIDLYSFAASSTKHLAIQGRKDFQLYDYFKIGVNAAAGTYTFTSTSDGIFTSTPYYIYDAADGEYHTLPYTFTLTTGVGVDNDNRFRIVFDNPTQISSPTAICGTTIPIIEQVVFSTQIPGATTYKFQVRTGGASPGTALVGVYDGNAGAPYKFTLNFAGITPNTTYYVSVATYKVDGVWAYGPICQLTTPNPPTSKIYSPVCGITIINSWQRIDAQLVNARYGINATKYRFNVKVGGIAFGSPYETTNAYCNLNNFGATVLPSTAYEFTVDTYWDSAWRIGTESCIINTGNPITRLAGKGLEVFAVKAYPNPFSDSFKLDINTPMENPLQVMVYDMLGRQIENYTIEISNADSIEIGETFKSGVYNVVVKQGENIQIIRVVKR